MSIEHQGPRGCVSGGGWFSSLPWDVCRICASLQLAASDIAVWTVSRGEVSFPLKSLSFRAFQIYHKSHGTLSRIEDGVPNSFARQMM